MHNSDAISILNCVLDCPVFYAGARTFSKRKTNHSKTWVANPSMCIFQVALFELQTPANDGNVPGDFDSRAEMSVRVWKMFHGRNTLTL